MEGGGQVIDVGGRDVYRCTFKQGNAAAADGKGHEIDRKIVLSARNIEGAKIVPTREVNVYDLLNHKHVVLTEAAARKLSEALAAK